jgi:hypothetical protein
LLRNSALILISGQGPRLGMRLIFCTIGTLLSN